MEIYVYGLIFVAYLVLGFLSGEESGRTDERMARYIRRKTQEWGRRKKGIRISDESAVRREISTERRTGWSSSMWKGSASCF